MNEFVIFNAVKSIYKVLLRIVTVFFQVFMFNVAFILYCIYSRFVNKHFIYFCIYSLPAHFLNLNDKCLSFVDNQTNSNGFFSSQFHLTFSMVSAIWPANICPIGHTREAGPGHWLLGQLMQILESWWPQIPHVGTLQILSLWEAVWKVPQTSIKSFGWKKFLNKKQGGGDCCYGHRLNVFLCNVCDTYYNYMGWKCLQFFALHHFERFFLTFGQLIIKKLERLLISMCTNASPTSHAYIQRHYYFEKLLLNSKTDSKIR